MALSVQRATFSKLRLVGVVIAVAALTAQPYVGVLFDKTVHAAPVTDHVVINEISPSPTSGKAEWIELYNPTFTAINDLSDWTLTDANNHATTLFGSIGANGFATFNVSNFNNGGDTAYLRNGTAVIDSVTYKTILPNHTWARTYDASGDFEDRATGTPNTSNGAIPVVPAVVGLVEDTTSGKNFSTIQGALSDSSTKDNDTITLNGDLTTTSAIAISRPITLEGKGHTITASDSVTSSVIDVLSTSNVAISNLTVNSNGVYIRGINAYHSIVNLNNVTIKNSGKDGLVVNASTVVVNNITTSGNAWDGIDVDKPGAVLTVNGTSSHTEAGNAIYLDDTTTGAKVIDTNNQYFISHPNKEGQNPNDRAYNLDRSNLIVNVTSPTDNGAVSTASHKLIVTGSFTATLNGANYLQTQLVYKGNNKGIVTTYGAVTNGTLAAFDTTGLPEGDGYYLAVVGTDTLGNVSARKIINFTIDNTKPVAAFTSATANPTPNGYYNGDFQVGYTVTDNVKLKGMNISLRDAHDTSGNQWRANCYDNQVEASSSDIGECTVKLPANLPDGEYYLQIGAQDAAGNWATAATRTVRIQRAVPAQPANLQVKYQDDSNYIAGGSTLWQNAKGSNNLALTWSDRSGDWVDGHDVKVTYPDGTTDSFHQGPNTNSWLIYNNFGKKGNGRYVYSVVADNPNGASVPSDTFTLYYDTQSPTASFTSTLTHYINGDFRVTGVADDNVRLSSAFFDVRDSKGYVAGCEAGTFTISYNSDHTHADLSCIINTSKLVNGQSYTVRIHDGDTTNHYGGGEDRQFIFNTDAPIRPQGLQVKFQNDDSLIANNTYLNITAKPNGNNLELIWNQPTDWVTGYHVLATYPNDSTIHVGYQGPNSNAWLMYNGFGQYGDGAYVYRVEAVNPNGSTVSSEEFTLNYDTIQPVVSSIVVTDSKGKTQDANGASLRGNVTFHVNQTETNPNRLYVEYDQKDSGGKWQKLANTGWVYDKNVADLSVDTTKWADGDYQVKVSTDDKAWNHGGTSATFKVDNTPASVSFTSPSDFSKPFAIGPNVTVKASDATSGIGVFVIHVYDSSNKAAKFCTASAAQLAAGEVSCDLSALPSGTYHVLAGVNDKSGNNTTIKSGDFVIDTERPNATIISPRNDSFAHGNFTIQGTASDSQTGIDHVNIYVSRVVAPDANGKTFGGYAVENQPVSAFDSATGAFTYDVSGLADGAYVIKAVAFDKAGNSHFANAANVTVDSTAPTMTINSSNGKSVTGTTDNPGDAVTVDGNAASVDTVANPQGTYNWSFTPTQPYGVGTTKVTVISTDAAGNATQETASVVVAPAPAAGSTPTAPTAGTSSSNSVVTPFVVTPNNDAVALAQATGTNSDTAVLGAQTSKSADGTNKSTDPLSDTAVLGASDAKGVTWNIFGLAWYWWLAIVAALAAIVWGIVAAARRASDTTL